jgi:tetratricopeptide (TPR) repeat protein
MGDLPAATNEIARARELDPLSPAIEGHVATTEYFARRYDRALAAFARSIAMDPESWLTRVYHGLALAAVERYPEAVQEPIAGLGYVCARAGDSAQARVILAQLQASPLVPRSHLALIHVGLGENAQAIDELEKAAAQHDVLVSYLAVQPVLDPLRGEPRFRELLARVGLTPRA